MKIRLTIILSFFVIYCQAQEWSKDTVYQLSEFQITSKKIDQYTIGLKRINLDSISIAISGDQNLSELLESYLPVYFKSYGQGSLSTISLRGTAPEHTGVYWNGFKINSPNIGMQDLALIPVTFFNSIGVIQGGSSSLFGEGNIGGSIHLENSPEFKNNKKLILGLGIGSFHDYQSKVKAIVSSSKMWSSTSVQYNNALNDFSYINLSGQREKRENTALQRISFIQDLAWNHRNNIFKASLWFQDTYREIPKTLTTSESQSNQKDQSVRASLNWKKVYKKSSYDIKSALLMDDLTFKDPLLQIHSNIKTIQIPTELFFNYQLSKDLSISSGINYIYQKGISINYGSDISRNQYAANASVLWNIPVINWKANGNFRFEYVDAKKLPLISSIGFEGKIWKYLIGRLSASRNYRLPSFNDLYWIPFGNADLLPEDAFSKEAGLIFNIPLGGNIKTELSVDYFNINIDDRIIWLPENNIWKPENVQKVFSRGIELNEKTELHFNEFAIHIMLSYSLTKSTNKSDTITSTFQKQLIYVPKHIFSGSLRFIYKEYIMKFQHQFTSERYTLSDNSSSLPPYHLDNFSFIKQLKILGKSMNIKINIHNILDTEYEAIQYYPVPGRSLYFGFVYSL